MARTDLNRRNFLRACLSMPAIVLAACSNQQSTAPTSAPSASTAPTSAPAAPSPTGNATAPPTAPATAAPVSAPTNAPTVVALQPTPACDDDDEPTPTQAEGPYFTPNSPERSSLIEAGMAGTAMVLSGVVIDSACRPVARALLDFWHADDAGVYDNQGYRLRGHIYSDDAGRFSLTTIMPGLYPGRTRHFHVKVQAPNGPILTTQLYFPGEPANARDRIYQPELEMQVRDAPDGKQASFTFVIVTA